MRGFGPLSELLQELTPEDRAEVDRIKAEMQREEDRLVASGQAGPRAGSESRNQPDEAVSQRPAGALRDSTGTGR